jgi:hypothetical protein
MPRAGLTPHAGRGNPDADRDPDDVGDVIGRFRAMPSDPPTSGVERANLREAWYAVRGRGTVPRNALAADIYDGTITKVHRRGEWWRFIRAYLPFLPGVQATDDAGLRFDPDADADRPKVPDDPATPTTDVVDAAITDAIDDVGLKEPNAEPHLANRNERAIRAAYDTLTEDGRAGRGTLQEHYTTTTAPVDGLYADQARGFRLVVAPVLRWLPCVDAPPVVGGEWRYVGTDVNRV